MKRRYLEVAAGLILCSVVAVQASEQSDKAIVERIKPVGEVCLVGEACAAAVATASSGDPRSAEDIYTSSCTSCHAAGIAGAPKFGDPGAWESRMENGVETLYTNAIKGINAMPAKGLCADCTDDDIKATVDYMVENSVK